MDELLINSKRLTIAATLKIKRTSADCFIVRNARLNVSAVFIVLPKNFTRFGHTRDS